MTKGFVSINGELYTATINTSGRILLRQNAAGNNGITWTTNTSSVPKLRKTKKSKRKGY